jgi:hypothetical protein
LPICCEALQVCVFEHPEAANNLLRDKELISIFFFYFFDGGKKHFLILSSWLVTCRRWKLGGIFKKPGLFGLNSNMDLNLNLGLKFKSWIKH